jgi:hypothetical protein
MDGRSFITVVGSLSQQAALETQSGSPEWPEWADTVEEVGVAPGLKS